MSIIKKFKLTVHMKIKAIIFTSILVMFAFPAAYAQDSVENLQDLINVKGRDGEYQMKDRGYTWIRSHKSGGDAYSYWNEIQSGRCVSVRTSLRGVMCLLTIHLILTVMEMIRGMGWPELTCKRGNFYPFAG